MFESPWEPIGDLLDETFETQKFYHQAFDGDNFLEVLTPLEGDETTFYGTNVLNVFIAQKAYGWRMCGDDPNQRTFEWPPEGFEEARTRYLESRSRWPSYQTLIWVDFWTPTQNQSFFPASEWLTMMEDTDAAIQEFCNTTEGFVYMGRIESQVEPIFFEEAITAFFGSPAYRR